MPVRKSLRIRGLLSAVMMISMLLGKPTRRLLTTPGVVYGWTILQSSTRPTQRNFAFQRRAWPRTLYPQTISTRATLQDREYNTTATTSPDLALAEDPSSANTGTPIAATPTKPLPDKLKIQRQQATVAKEQKTSPSQALRQTTDEWTEHNWKQHPELNPTFTFPTWAVPLQNASIIQTLLSSNLTQPFLATRDEILQQCHPRPKIVQDGDNKPRTHKYILLHPSATDQPIPPELEQLLQQNNVNTQGPEISIPLQYHQFQVNYILQKLLPQETHPPPAAFETVGHVAHLNLKEHHQPYANLIGQVIRECAPGIETVIQKVGKVDGPYRTYDYQVLAGRNDTKVKLHEHGISLAFDLSQVYWCSRLAQERQMVLEQELKPNQVVADAFCGVGAILLRAAQTKHCTILANDWNPKAVYYLEQNFAKNKLDRHLAAVTNQDAYDFLMDLGFEKKEEVDDDDNPGDWHDSPLPALVADHILLNFPLKAPSFLGALRWWSPPLSESSPRLHVYLFARADPETERTAEDVAVDTMASELLPLMPSGEADEEEECGVNRRKQELDEDFGCQIVAREVRDVAPGKLVFCVSFTATPKLLRHMQGDFDD